jgi:outer membrane protein TolC
MAHHVVARRAEQVNAIAQARAALVRASGLAPDSPMLDDDGHAGVELVRQLAAAAPSEHEAREVRELLARQPSLQVARARLVEAEAEVRIACAEQWPALLIGPKARFTADDFLFGGLLRLELPWPQAASAAVDAARARRDEAHAELADAFAAAQARQSAAVSALVSARESADEHARIVDQASARRWIAARARFAVDPAVLNDWTMALDQREQALTANAAALRDFLQASFEFAAARGPDPEPAPAPENRHE